MRIRTISVRLCEDKFEARARFFLAGQFLLAARECFLEVIMQATRVRVRLRSCRLQARSASPSWPAVVFAALCSLLQDSCAD